MGKSPAKWVKNILRGKKSSKSYPSKKAADESNASVPPQASSTELSGTSPMSNLAPPTMTTEMKSEMEQARSGRVSYENAIPVAANETDESCAAEFNSSKEAVNLGLTNPATEAPQEYHSLEGITMLQALVRGHLVRRQALATLHCVRGIVKLQAVARGRRIRCSDTGLELRKKCSFQDADVTETSRFSSSIILGKQSSNAFASKILASSISSLPLNLQYDPDEPNSAPKWLERWSSSHFWGSAAHQKEALSSNSKQQDNKTVKAEPKAPAVPKNEGRKVAATNMDNSSSVHSSLDHGKPKRNNRKHVTPNEETVVQDNPENELERVKRSLRKITLNNKEASGKSEPAVEVPKKSTRNGSVSPAPISKSEVANEELNHKPEMKKPVLLDSIIDETNPIDAQPEKPEAEAELESLVVHEPNDLSLNHSTEPCPGENGVDVEKYSSVNEEKVSKEENYMEYDPKLRRRSVPLKQEYIENSPQNNRTVPSYMAATASAKAKLRGLGSPKVAEEGEDEAVIRRHSLPSSANGKLSSMPSPRMHKVVGHANGKDRTRTDRSLTSSRDGQGKVLKPDWRR